MPHNTTEAHQMSPARSADITTYTWSAVSIVFLNPYGRGVLISTRPYQISFVQSSKYPIIYAFRPFHRCSEYLRVK